MNQMGKSIVKKGANVYLREANSGLWYYYNPSDAPLGSGAMGTVYFGRAYRDRYQMVAIKRVVDKYAEIPSIRKRAKYEGSLAFCHRNLIEMLGYCEDESEHGPIYIISKLVPGVSLKEHVETNLRHAPNSFQKIVRCLLPVFDALEYLHRKGIVHLDVKPSNIMVENGSNIRLMDLGIASASAEIYSDKGGVLGTPGFAAPEQYVEPGQHELKVNETTDIYGLGATLYDLLSGEKPYANQEEKLKAIPGIPRSVMKVLRVALSKEQGSRYQSVAEFKEALLRAMDKKPFPWIIILLSAIVLIASVVVIIIANG